MPVNDCAMCELDTLLRERSEELRVELRRLRPIAPEFDHIFRLLADVDTDRRMLATEWEDA